MGRIVINHVKTPSRYLQLHTLVGWLSNSGLRDYSGKNNHLVSTYAGLSGITSNGYGAAKWTTNASVLCAMNGVDGRNASTLDLSKSGRSWMVHYRFSFLGGLSGTNALIGKSNDTSLSAGGFWLGNTNNNILSTTWRQPGGILQAVNSAAALTQDVVYGLTWMRDAVANTMTLWIDGVKDAALKDVIWDVKPDITNPLTIGAIIPESGANGMAGGGTVTGKTVSNMQIYWNDGPLPAWMGDGSAIAWLLRNQGQHLKDEDWGA